MKISFNTPARKRLIAGLALAFAAFYLGLVVREFLASWLGSRAQLTSLQAAVWLDSGNAAYRNHLGRYYDFVRREPATALGYYKAAVALNPHSARYWFDLASAYQILGDVANQTVALERAIQADSMTPDVAWEAANLYLVRGENDKALREFRVVMANDSSLASSAIRFCWRIEPDVDLLLRDAVPPTAPAELAFLNLRENDINQLLRQVTSPTENTDVASLALKIKNETADTFKIWNALIESHDPFEERYAYEYIQFLLNFREVSEAQLVWHQAAGRFEQLSYLPSPTNLVVNPAFSLPVLNNGFDWQYAKQSDVDLKVDDTIAHGGGAHSLRITFHGAGISDAGIFQFVPVQPNTTYQFSAYYRTDPDSDNQFAGGPHFTIQDMFSSTPKILYESDELKGAESWRRSDGDFTTGPDCRLVKLLIRRLPEGYPIRGKLWIDDFRISRKPS